MFTCTKPKWKNVAPTLVKIFPVWPPYIITQPITSVRRKNDYDDVMLMQIALQSVSYCSRIVFHVLYFNWYSFIILLTMLFFLNGAPRSINIRGAPGNFPVSLWASPPLYIILFYNYMLASLYCKSIVFLSLADRWLLSSLLRPIWSRIENRNSKNITSRFGKLWRIFSAKWHFIIAPTHSLNSRVLQIIRNLEHRVL